MSTAPPAPGGPGPSLDPEDIRRAREAKRRLFSPAQVRNPHIFVATDNPLQTLAPPQIRQAMKRLEAIAFAEGSAIEATDWHSEISSGDNLESNVEHLLEIGGKLPEGERERVGLRAMDEAEGEQIERNRATEAILDVCERLDVAGVDGADVLEAVFAEQGAQAAAMLEGTDFTEDGIEDLLDGIAAEFDPLFVSDAIAECRDMLAGPEMVEREVATRELLDELRDRFGINALSTDRAFAKLEARLQRAESESQQAATNRLSRAFGMKFENLDDAIDRLRQHIAQARGERLRIADVRVRRAGGDTRVFIASDDPAFDGWTDNVRRRVTRELDLSEIPSPSTVTVGEILVRGETLDEIDLTQGREQLGAVAEPQPLPQERAARDQETLPEAETPADELADRIIALGER